MYLNPHNFLILIMPKSHWKVLYSHAQYEVSKTVYHQISHQVSFRIGSEHEPERIFNIVYLRHTVPNSKKSLSLHTHNDSKQDIKLRKFKNHYDASGGKGVAQTARVPSYGGGGWPNRHLCFKNSLLYDASYRERGGWLKNPHRVRPKDLS